MFNIKDALCGLWSCSVGRILKRLRGPAAPRTLTQSDINNCLRPTISNSYSWDRERSDDSLRTKWGDDERKRGLRIFPPSGGRYAPLNEPVVRDESQITPTNIIRGVLKHGERLRREAGHNAQTIDIRVTFSDGRYDIHSTYTTGDDASS